MRGAPDPPDPPYWGGGDGDTRRKQAATQIIYLGPPNTFLDSESPIKLLLGGADERCPDP